MSEPLTAEELAELAASIDHLSGPDAWDDDRLEPALIPVTHYVPRLMAEVVASGGEPHETHLIAWDGPIARLDITWARDPEQPGSTVKVDGNWGWRIAEAAKQIVTGDPQDA